LLHINIFQGSKLAYNHHTSGLENIKDKTAAAPYEYIELMDSRTYKTKKTCPCLKKQGIDAGSTSLVARHCLANDDTNGENAAMTMDADVKLIVFNLNKTKWYSNQDTKAAVFLPDLIPRKGMQLMFVVEDQNKKWFSVLNQVNDGYEINI
jgi:hypothetical protein